MPMPRLSSSPKGTQTIRDNQVCFDTKLSKRAVVVLEANTRSTFFTAYSGSRLPGKNALELDSVQIGNVHRKIRCESKQRGMLDVR